MLRADAEYPFPADYLVLSDGQRRPGILLACENNQLFQTRTTLTFLSVAM